MKSTDSLPETQPFWSALEAGKLRLKDCDACGEVHYYPRSICPFCGSDRTRWIEASGRGRLYAYTVMRRASPPYCLAMVELEEGPTMMTNIVESDFGRLGVAAPVVLQPTKLDDGSALPTFRLADPAASNAEPEPLATAPGR